VNVAGAQKSNNGRIIRGGQGVMQAYVKVIVILSLSMTIGLVGCNLLSDSEITVYPVGTYDGKLIFLNRTTFKVSVARQDIISWSPDVKFPPSRLRNCVVVDRKNWTGEYSDGSGELSMVDGKFYEEPSYPDTFYVKGWRWWFITIKSWFGLYEKMARE
jgi:hypothetical protein